MTSKRLVIMQGEQAVSRNPEVVLSTLLGSCVAVCLWDAEARLGGLNHILLAAHRGGNMQKSRDGRDAMEQLIGSMIDKNAVRANLVAKVFGGARMVDGLSQIGPANAEFVVQFLHSEGIPIVARSTGGTVARHLMFWPTTGVARLRGAVAQT